MIIILSILIAMALLTIGLNVGIKDFKKLRGIVEDEKLTETIKKFPSNTEICKQTLKKLNKEDVKVEEDNSSKTSVYLVFKNKIVMGRANVITRIQTVIHECIHSTQDKRLLKFNVIFANINNLYLLIISILSLFNKISYNTATICLWVLALSAVNIVCSEKLFRNRCYDKSRIHGTRLHRKNRLCFTRRKREDNTNI